MLPTRPDVEKIFVAIIGGTKLSVCAASLVLPGRGVPVVAVGLALRATEFFRARRAWCNAKRAAAKEESP